MVCLLLLVLESVLNLTFQPIPPTVLALLTILLALLAGARRETA